MKALLSFFAPGGSKARLSILIFHRVVASPDPLCRDLPDAAEFERCMRWIRDWFNVLPLEEAARRLACASLPPRPLAITFDDGYADNEAIAMPILLRLGLTATIFVCPGFLDGGRMWNDDVIECIRAFEGSELDLTALGLTRLRLGTDEDRERAVDRILTAIKHLPIGERAARVEEILALAGGRRGPELMMTRAQVARLHAAGMTIGGHTVNHPILTSLRTRAAMTEIAEGKEQLEEIVKERISLFAYPNGVPGRDYAAEHVEMVRSCGFECGVSTAWGVATLGVDPLQLPRFTPWDRSKLRFGMHMLRNLARTSFATVERSPNQLN
jgi:peptidoglycan/xylan/chitin deacetylase (PgdA/CDA1 family)